MPTRAPMHTLMAAFFAAIGVFALVFTMGGCSTAQLDQLADEVRKTQTEIAAQLAELPPEGQSSPSQAKARELLEQAQAVGDQTLAGIADARERGVIATIADAVLPFIPAPWRELVLTMGGIGTVLETLRRKARGLASLSRSMVSLSEASPQVSKAIDEYAGKLRKSQNRAARRAIDKAQSDLAEFGAWS